MTPDEFKVSVQIIITGGGNVSSWDTNPEHGHYTFDKLMERVLRELGYGEGIDLVTEECRWYA